MRHKCLHVSDAGKVHHRRKKKSWGEILVLWIITEGVGKRAVIETHSGQKWLPRIRHVHTEEAQHSPLIVTALPNKIIWCVSDGPAVTFLFVAAGWGSLTDNWRLIHTLCLSVCLSCGGAEHLFSRSDPSDTFQHMLTLSHPFIIFFCSTLPTYSSFHMVSCSSSQSSEGWLWHLCHLLIN